MKIGEVAKIASVNVETIRYYERKGLIVKPSHMENGYRFYDQVLLRRIKFIKNAQKVGFSLKEIEELLSLKVEPSKDCSIVKAKALDKIKEIQIKIDSLIAMRDSLTEMAKGCHGDGPTSNCNILTSLDRGDLNESNK